MATLFGIALALLLATVGVSTYAVSTDSQHSNRISPKDIESRSDYPDLKDLSSFFDFELGPSSESEREYEDRTEPTKRRNKYYYYYKAGGPKYPENIYVPPEKEQQVVTPGTHYKPQKSDNIIEHGSLNESKPAIHQTVIGSYQVSVVDADSPLLKDLGLNKNDLEKLTRRSLITNVTMLGSDSIPSATYAENPRPDYQHNGYAPTHAYPPPSNAPPPYEPSKYPYQSTANSGRHYAPRDYYPSDNENPPQRGYGSPHAPSQPPPQGSYDAKSYAAIQNPPPPSSNYNYAPPPPPGPQQHPHNHHYPASSYTAKRSSPEPWRQVPQTHTDWDDKQSRKPDSYHPPQSSYHPSAPSSGPPPNSVPYPPRPSYGSSTPEKPGYRYASYKPPASKPTYSSSPSASEYHSHKPSYYPSYSTSSKAPSRAGSTYPSHHQQHEEPSKPGITIRFKAKAPGHHSSGMSIPVNFNPLEVVKKLLPLSAFNPLNNKKVTIGITIENKKESQHDYHSSY